MITARTAFQIFRSETNGTVSDFNALAQEVALPFKIRAAEETMLGSLRYVEENAEDTPIFAVSVVHSVCVYLSTLASFFPLMARSTSAEQIAVNYTALARAVALFGGHDNALVRRIMELVATAPDAKQISFTELSDLEAAFSTIEKSLKAKAKETGERCEALRKVAPEKPQGDVSTVDSAAPSPRKSERRSPSKPAGAGADDNGNATQVPVTDASGGGDDGSRTAADAPPQKSTKSEAPPSSSTTTRRRPAGKKAHLVWGRLRALTNAEKKAVGVLNQIIHLLGHVFANKYNDLVPVFDHLLEQVRQVQAIVDAERAAYEQKEDRKPPAPFHEVSLQELKAAISQSSQTFRDDEYCRLWLDEDLLHPIAHACLTLVNQIEGYETAPFVPPSAEELAKKHSARVALKEKREEAQRKLVERAKAREELANKKEEEKRQLQQQLGHSVDEETLVEDTELTDATPVAYVAYPRQLPLGSAEAYEKALFIWCMITSVPGALSLSQMPFSLFLKGLQEEDQEANGLMEEITRCLLDVSIEHVRVNSPNTPRITTRGKNWFDALVEFVGVASGNKKQRRQQRRAPTPSEDDADEDDEDDDDDDDEDDDEDEDEEETSSSSSASETAEPDDEENPQPVDHDSTAVSGAPATDAATNEEQPTDAAQTENTAAAAPPQEEEVTGFEKELKNTMENVVSLRSLATWGNVDLEDRLNLLQFCVQEAVASDAVRAAADAALKVSEEQASAVDKRLKEIRDEAAKELKGLLKNISTSSPTTAAAPRKEGSADDQVDRADADNKLDADGGDYEQKKRAILSDVDGKREEVLKEVYASQDGRDLDILITPLGMDRYKRLYWRFPFERVVHVQSTSLTAPSIPAVGKPAETRNVNMGYLFQHEEENEEDALLDLGRKRGRAAEGSTHTAVGDESADPSTQSTWGVVPAEYLRTFIQSLDSRGEREAHLRRTLESLAPYLLSIEEEHETRVTRARAHTFGYLNKLKTFF